MPTEGLPPAEPSLLSKPLGWLTRLVLRFPVPTIALGVGLAVFALVLAGTRLGFRTSRLDLINSKSSYNQLWIDYINEFGDEDDVVVVVEGPSREMVVPVLEELSGLLREQDRFFHAVHHEIDLSRIRSKGLHYIETDELRNLFGFLGETTPIVDGGWAKLNLGRMASGMVGRLEAAQRGSVADRGEAVDQASRLADSLSVAMIDRDRYRSPWPAMPGLVGTLSELSGDYLLAKEGRLGFVFLRLVDSGEEDSFARGSEAIDRLRELIASVQAEHALTEIGLTGLPVMENDEMRSSQTSMMEASGLSLIGVACLFIAGFGGVRHPIMTVGALLIAMAWSFGYITLSVGHLNILSVSFGVILIGLGIDFGVHYAARYLQLHAIFRSSEKALVATAEGVGPGIVTGALTTTVAFLTAGLTEFTGVAELGIIAGGGILLCCIAAMVVLPAMIHLSDHQRAYQPLPRPLDLHGWLVPLMRRPRLVLFVGLAGTAALASGISQLWYDHNLLNLQPEGLESVELEKKLLSEADRSVWYALSIAKGPDELKQRKRQFESKPSVERVESLARFFPTDYERKLPLIRQIDGMLDDLPERPPRIPVDPPADLGRSLARLQMLLANQPGAGRAVRQLEQSRDALRRMPLSECYARLTEYQQRVAGDLLSRLHAIRSIANPDPPTLADLPEALVTRFVGHDGHYLLKIYAKADIWDMEAMGRFVSDVRSVDSRATGNPLQTYEASRAMKRSYEQAAWYALAAVLMIIFLDFRSLRYTLLAMVPVALGMLQMFGVLGLLGIPLNPANMIVLPLILGIGIDDGVHVVHDFRLQKGRYRLSASTASAVLITSLTTMVGFGSLMIASHRGLQSLGRVLTLGVSCCLVTSLVLLPALLTWLTRRRADSDGEMESGLVDSKTGESTAGGDGEASAAPAPHAAAAARRQGASRPPVRHPRHGVASGGASGPHAAPRSGREDGIAATSPKRPDRVH